MSLLQMSYLPVILPRYEISLLILVVIITLIGGICHQAYLLRVQAIVRKTADSAFDRRALLRSLHISQGSNFNTLMILSWSLFLAALIFLYFLTPDIFPDRNYFLFPQMASGSYGLAVFGIAVVLIPGLLIALIVPRVYSYYLISRWLKNLNLLTPLFLITSLFCSINLAAVYPLADRFVWNLGYGALLVSLVLLLLPIVIGFAEEMR
jgi:hypothetical protein